VLCFPTPRARLGNYGRATTRERRIGGCHLTVCACAEKLPQDARSRRMISISPHGRWIGAATALNGNVVDRSRTTRKCGRSRRSSERRQHGRSRECLFVPVGRQSRREIAISAPRLPGGPSRKRLVFQIVAGSRRRRFCYGPSRATARLDRRTVARNSCAENPYESARRLRDAVSSSLVVPVQGDRRTQFFGLRSPLGFDGLLKSAPCQMSARSRLRGSRALSPPALGVEFDTPTGGPPTSTRRIVTLKAAPANYSLGIYQRRCNPAARGQSQGWISSNLHRERTGPRIVPDRQYKVCARTSLD